MAIKLKRAIKWALAGLLAGTVAANDLEKGFVSPPPEARLHSYWWWLNGNVTEEAITRDLEAMKEKGVGGALIIDAGGANQDGNRQVPRGPLFASEAWRELYRHALREAARLKLEMALNIQSGWNLGGPRVVADDAAKILCYTETAVEGPGEKTVTLAAPPSRHGLLKDVAVLAIPSIAVDPAYKLEVSSEHADYPVRNLTDGHSSTFWVSNGTVSEEDAYAWIRITLPQKRDVRKIILSGRPGYGPRAADVFLLSEQDRRERVASTSECRPDGTLMISLYTPAMTEALEVRITAADDPQAAKGRRARNVQIIEFRVEGEDWGWPQVQPVISNWEKKTLLRPVHGGNGSIAQELAPTPGGTEAKGIDPRHVVDLTGQMAADGKLTWTPPAGAWKILRFCYTVGPRAHVSTCSQGWDGLALDPMDAEAFQRYWDDVIEPLMSDAKAIPGGTLRYLHTDSWEIEPYNWTARLPEEFRKRRGYEITPWLPVMARQVIGSVEASERFLHDFRKTVAELTAENYYGPFLVNAHRHGLEVRAESGGPHGVPIDAQHCLGMIDVPMSEFWATSWRHRVTDAQRFFVKQPASAAHTYGKKLVAAEGFTTIGPHWQETVWDNLKPNFDRALCEGLNQLVWTLVTCSPEEMGLPGQEMFPGTHFNPNSTWWQHSEGFLSYINRCQSLLQQGLFVADVLYYYGDLAPNFAGLKAMNPAGLPPGYDYDVASEYVLLNRVSVKNGRIVLPDGMSYGALVLPPHPNMSSPVLRKLRELAADGATLIGPRPESSSGLLAWQKSDAEAQDLLNQLWGTDSRKGLVKHDTATDWLKASSLAPDFEVVGSSESNTPLDYIHRQDGETEIYFVANPNATALRVDCLFRVKDRQAELWDPVTGEMRVLAQSEMKAGRTSVSLDFVPYGSMFVVFRKEKGNLKLATGNLMKSFPELKPVQELTGPWAVQFDPAWFYPDNGTGGKMTFNDLSDWTLSPETAIKYYSGLATYRKSFDWPTSDLRPPTSFFLSLGAVREMARVRLNGHDLGVVWCPPWNIRIPAGTLKEKENRLEIEVVNFWPNRLIGDAGLPLEQRRTWTNITKFYEPKGDPHYTTLMPSGLLGPVVLQKAVVE